jgi:superfamily II DNA or RNA helicase
MNGQALCPACNLKKGDNMAQPLRVWQEEALERYEAAKKRDFLCCACPGAGKTTWTLTLARRLLDRGTVQRVVIIAPSESVRDQWLGRDRKNGQRIIHLEASENAKGGHENYTDFEGCALTYAQVAAQPDLQRKACSDRHTLVIFDEIHHAGDNKSWGQNLIHGFENATLRIGLTGTPWRRPKSGSIPFVAYDYKGEIQPDYSYSYGKAVSETPPACRVLQFHAYDANIQCTELELATSATMSLSDLADVEREDRSQAMRAILDPKQEWIPTILGKAIAELTTIRAGTVDDGAVPDAQGLVIADDQPHARAIRDLLQSLTGEKVELIVSDEKDARDALNRFRERSCKWAVAVNMVSEGVDVAQLYVGVYATRKTSPLLFRQIAGRFVRRRGETETRDAVLFVPAVPDLLAISSEIQSELRHAIELAIDEEERKRAYLERLEASGELDDEPNLRAWTAVDATLDSVLRGKERFTPDEYREAEQDAVRLQAQGYAFPNPAMLAQYKRMLGLRADVQGNSIGVRTVAQEMSKEHRKRLLKKQLDSTAKHAAITMNIDFQTFGGMLVRRFGKGRDALTMEEIGQEIHYIDEMLRKFKEESNG